MALPRTLDEYNTYVKGQGRPSEEYDVFLKGEFIGRTVAKGNVEAILKLGISTRKSNQKRRGRKSLWNKLEE